jgi:heptosyltransferase II
MECEKAGKRILVLRYRFIGDTILTIPFLRNLRRAEPDAYIAWVVAPGSSDVVQGIPYVDELIFWDPVTIHADSRGGHRTWWEKLAYVRMLRVKHFDTAYVLKRSFSSAIMALLCGARKRVGFATEGRSFMLTRGVPYNRNQHEVENFLDVLRADGIQILDDHLEAWITDDETAAAMAILLQSGFQNSELLVGMHPFASSKGKRWPLERYAELSHHLAADGYRPLVLGAQNERQEFDDASGSFSPMSINAVGRCDLRVTLALLKKCQLYVGNDSGIMHLAASAGLPLVTIFGSTSPQLFGPWGKKATIVSAALPCAPCRQKFFTECQPSERGYPPCLEAVTVEMVLSSLRQKYPARTKSTIQ